MLFFWAIVFGLALYAPLKIGEIVYYKYFA